MKMILPVCPSVCPMLDILLWVREADREPLRLLAVRCAWDRNPLALTLCRIATVVEHNNP